MLLFWEQKVVVPSDYFPQVLYHPEMKGRTPCKSQIQKNILFDESNKECNQEHLKIKKKKSLVIHKYKENLLAQSGGIRFIKPMINGPEKSNPTISSVRDSL